MFRVFRILAFRLPLGFFQVLELKVFHIPSILLREKAIYDNSPLASLGASLLYDSQSLYRYERRSSEFFRFPAPLWGEAQNFSKTQGLYIGIIISHGARFKIVPHSIKSSPIHQHTRTHTTMFT